MPGRTTITLFARESKGLPPGLEGPERIAGANRILAEGRRRGLSRQTIAYVLATVYHETAGTMQPIRERGHGAGHAYGIPDPETGQVYHGRGYVQLTWRENYQRLGERLGVDLVHQPDLLLVPEISVQVLYVGMVEGLFTGAPLRRYINQDRTDYVNARRVVNGTDRARQIAGYAEVFERALTPQTPAPRAVAPAVTVLGTGGLAVGTYALGGSPALVLLALAAIGIAAILVVVLRRRAKKRRETEEGIKS